MSQPRIHLYHCADARSFRALWALEELGLPYELTLMPFPPRARFEGYRDVNPLGTVPACLIDGQLMTESAAIPHVLATRFGPSDLALAPDEPDYPSYMNFLVMGEATLTFPQTIHLRYTRLEPGRCLEAASDYAQWFGARLHNALKLMGPEFACAGRFTMADVYLTSQFDWGLNLKLLPRHDAFLAYAERCHARPAYQATLAADRELYRSTKTEA